MNKIGIETYIFVHDKEIISLYENSNKFSSLGDYKYVFLGDGDIDGLKNYNNIIIARDLPYNLESYPKMCAYSGWYVLYKNNLIKSKIVNLFEYDVVLIKDFINKLISLIKDGIDFYGYVPLDINVNFLDNPSWSGRLDEFYGDLKRKVWNKCFSRDIELWSATSNVTMTNEFFYRYMTESEDLFNWIKEYQSAGHELERNLSVYQILHSDINVKYVSNALTHYQLDSHKTQGIFKKDNDEIIEKLAYDR
jgi:hypothetical protein